LALNLTIQERECLEGKDAQEAGHRPPHSKFEGKLPGPIDHTEEGECDAERERIFRIMYRKRVLSELRRKVENLERRRVRLPDHQELSREEVLEKDRETRDTESKVLETEGRLKATTLDDQGLTQGEQKIDIFGDIAGENEKQFLQDFSLKGNHNGSARNGDIK
jgi:hypothetical protein